jgi:dTDP-4-amino-4,6-dideoxygalactose transaminase
MLNESLVPPVALESKAPIPVIPFNRACIAGREIEYVTQAMLSGHVSGDGTFTAKCSRLLEQMVGSPKALLTTSCTHALEMAALLLDLGPGDEVIVPSFTFVSTLNAIVLRGARPVCVDIRDDTLNIDERLIPEAITNRTKAVFLVHYAGVACEMDEIARIAREHSLVVVEDNAHGLLGTYKGKQLGTFGALATQSFHETKNFTCGEGGALLINDSRYIERAEIIREKGTDRSRFFRGQVDKYTWVDFGSSYLPSEVLAAYLYGQLEARDEIQRRRRVIWDRYNELLRDWALRNAVQTPHVPADCEHPSHIFYILMPSLPARGAFISHLQERGVMGVFHYVPLHLSPMGRQWASDALDLPVTESVSDRLVRLPLFHGMTVAEQERVVASVLEWRA